MPASTEASVSHRRVRRRRATGIAAIGATLVALLAGASDAGAVILPPVTLDGPSPEVQSVGGVAMAEDGTGGVVYLKRVGGVAHVFVRQFIGGQWLPAVRADGEEQFAASWPRIGAANGGELVVVWATPFATQHEHPIDELLGATLESGSGGFGPAILIDPNVADSTGLSPDLAVSPTGYSDVVYRVVRGGIQTVILRPGDIGEDVRVAHFDGRRWTLLGAINRNPGVGMRPPTSVNAPRIAIGRTGNGVVVWQEPEIEGVARIWARRLFGSSLDYVLPVSAQSFAGAPLETDADAPSVAVSFLGEAEVAYRQNVGPGSPLPGPRIYLNKLPDGESVDGSKFEGAAVADAAVSGGASATVGPPSVDIDDKQALRLIYDSNGVARVVNGTDLGLAGTVTLGPRFAGGEQSSVSVMNPSGGGVSAWPSADAAGDAAVAVREDFPEGAVQTGLVSGGAGGEVGELAVGRSGLGDGLVAFRQGPFGNAAVVATEVSAPPEQLAVSAPKGWVRPRGAVVSWDEAQSANGPLRYEVVLDGRVQATPAGALSMRLDPRRLGAGAHQVQVLATDIDGQAVLSPPATLLVDAQPPRVRIARTRNGRGVAVRITDVGPGVAARTVSVRFGDGRGGARRTRFRHIYARAGVYTVIVRVADRLGNAAVVRRLVSVA
jgi:hypothetical protein